MTEIKRNRQPRVAISSPRAKSHSGFTWYSSRKLWW